jgi:hypothetical protein
MAAAEAGEPAPLATEARFEGWYDRGFPLVRRVELSAEALNDPLSLRQQSVTTHPEWFGANSFKLTGGFILTEEPLRTLLTLPAWERLTRWDLSGTVIERPITLGEETTQDDLAILPLALLETDTQPIITGRMVEALSEMRECRRLTELDLRHNELDNDAMHALADSRHFIRLRWLAVSEGNRFKGRTWQRLLERFGPDVVL